ncbi:hypothetical protein JST97_38435 [bacterium]|nr:hypothetical protein [bacterium]
MFEAITGFFSARSTPLPARPAAPPRTHHPERAQASCDRGPEAGALAQGQLRHNWEECLQARRGQDIVNDARKFKGQQAQALKGKLPQFLAAGGRTNDCADFVSSNLMNRGALRKKQVNVDALREQLLAEGYHRVSASQARPGDVLFFNDKRHTEIVSQAGGRMSIGSNNARPGQPDRVVHGQQWITEHAVNPQEVTYYAIG